MKKVTFTFLFALIASTFTLMAQVKNNLLKTSLTAPLIRTYTLAYERMLNDEMSLQLGFGYFGGWKLGDSKIDGFNLTPEFRYFLSEKKVAPSGGFVAPFLRYGSTGIESGEEGTEDYAKAGMTTIGGGVLIGVQRLFKETVSLEAFIGPAYYNSNLDIQSGAEEEFSTNLLDGFSVRLGATLGIAF